MPGPGARFTRRESRPGSLGDAALRLSRSPVHTMQLVATPVIAARPEGTRPPAPCASPARVRSWTGRSAMSCATDSALPHLVTAGTRRTRVSEMRISAAGTSVPAPSVHARALPAIAPFARRNSGIAGRSSG
jgi:hypothetical protein